MADDLTSDGHVMSTNMADDLISVDSVAPNLILTPDMYTNEVVRKHIWRTTLLPRSRDV